MGVPGSRSKVSGQSGGLFMLMDIQGRDTRIPWGLRVRLLV